MATQSVRNLYMEDSDEEERIQDRIRAKSAAVVDTGMSDVKPGALFQWLDRRDPHRARRRFGRLYWNAGSQIVMSMFLTLFGLTFVVIGLGCVKKCDEWDRGIAFFVIGLLLIMPGLYGGLTLLYYLRGKKGYSYKDLPAMN